MVGLGSVPSPQASPGAGALWAGLRGGAPWRVGGQLPPAGARFSRSTGAAAVPVPQTR